jgi:ribosomal protein S18 acetylase RimI-like enzyme
MISPAGVAACRFLDWDSEFFGCRIALLQESRLNEDALAQSLGWCRRERIDCLYFLADRDPATVALAEAAGFQLVDVRVTLETDPRDALPPPNETPVRPWMPADIGRLRSIAAASHLGSRFYRDGHFPVERCDELYSTWIERSCGADATQVFVAEFAQQAAGYISCHAATHEITSEGRIGLLGVDADARHLGFGQSLVLNALAWFRDRSIRSVTVVTQGQNVSARRLYQKAGFTTRSEQLWYHYWPAKGRLTEGSPDGRDH